MCINTCWPCILTSRRPAVQLFGHHPDLMGQAAQRLSELGRFSAIDINMGCPALQGDGLRLGQRADA